MEEYGKVKKVRIKHNTYGYQQQRAMIYFSNEKEAAIAIKETNNYKGGKQKNTKTLHKIKCTQGTTEMNTVSKNM